MTIHRALMKILRFPTDWSIRSCSLRSRLRNAPELDIKYMLNYRPQGSVDRELQSRPYCPGIKVTAMSNCDRWCAVYCKHTADRRLGWMERLINIDIIMKPPLRRNPGKSLWHNKQNNTLYPRHMVVICLMLQFQTSNEFSRSRCQFSTHDRSTLKDFWYEMKRWIVAPTSLTPTPSKRETEYIRKLEQHLIRTQYKNGSVVILYERSL